MRCLRRVRFIIARLYIDLPECSCISSAISIHVRELDSACDPYFTTMARTSWANWAEVSGPSAFTNDAMKAISQVTEAIKPGIEQKKYLRNLFDKVYKLVRLSSVLTD